MIHNKKDSVLKKIREALSQSVPIPFPESEGQSTVYTPLNQDIEVEFAERFTELQGNFAFCSDKKDLARQLHQLISAKGWSAVYCIDPTWKEWLQEHFIELKEDRGDLAHCEAAITGCAYLTARTGSIVMTAADPSGRCTSVYAPIHICIACTSQLVYDIKDALQFLKEQHGNKMPSLITFATGPSRTADIEKTLVVGVHGPKEVYVFLIDDKL